MRYQSLEDLFLGARTDAISQLGTSHFWPYADGWIDSINFRHKRDIQDLRDVYQILKKMEERDPDLANELNKTVEENLPESLRNDLEWRRAHLGVDNNFWNLNGPDIPQQFSEGLALRNEPKDQITPTQRLAEKSILSKLPGYEDLQLVRNAFRAFHRPDGKSREPQRKPSDVCRIYPYILGMCWS